MTLRLLIADDNEATQKMVRLAFAGEDVVIESVSSGDAALEMLKGFRPDAALIDVVMPGYSGYEVCELIRHDPEFASIPVILLSGAFDNFDEDEAARVRANGHLTKPFNPSEMITLVEKFLPDSMVRRADPDFPDNEAEEAYTGADITAGIPSKPVAVEPAAPTITVASTTPVAPTMPVAPAAPSELFQAAPRVWKSYLGPDRILEIITDDTIAGETAGGWGISEELIDRVAEKAVKKIVPDIKVLIQQTLSANKSGSPSR